MSNVRTRAREAFTHVCHDWRGLVAVTGLVVIGHHSHVLDAVDTYAFFTISHFLGSPPTRDVRSKVVVASIDPVSHETDYTERSPLDRCRLYQHLKTIYDAHPSLVVIDLDLSHARIVEFSEGEPSCEENLYRLVADKISEKTKTVLMDPFTMATTEAQAKVNEWRARMERAGVQFGHARMPSDWGVSVRHYCQGRSLAVVAYLAEPFHSPSWVSDSCLREREPKSFIDPSHYLGGIELVTIASPDPKPFDARLADALARIRPERGTLAESCSSEEAGASPTPT